MKNRYYFSIFLVGCVALLILAGGLVTSHEAGLAVPDWPLSYGQLMPPMVGNIFWEHGHRMIAGAVGILTLMMAVWTQIQEKRVWFRKLAWTAFAAVVLQALLGGLTVLLLLPPAVSIFHACLAQTFFCLTVWMAYGLSPAFSIPVLTEDGLKKRMRRLAVMTTGFIYIQLILGAIVRHTHQWVPAHVTMAILVLIHLVLTVNLVLSNVHSDPLLRRTALILAVFTVIQPLLGAGAWFHRYWMAQGYVPTTIRVFFTAAHQSMGAWILALSFLLTVRLWKK